jgi:hypothetical protein
LIKLDYSFVYKRSYANELAGQSGLQVRGIER